MNEVKYWDIPQHKKNQIVNVAVLWQDNEHQNKIQKIKLLQFKLKAKISQWWDRVGFKSFHGESTSTCFW